MLTKLARYLPAAEIKKIAATAQEVIEITALSPAKNLPLTVSKIGGIGYWPEDQTYPKNAEGQPLALLAQFNLAELPHLPEWPEQGLLVFYIDPFSDLNGMDYENLDNHSGYRTVYFPDTNTPSLTREAQRTLFPEYAFHDDLQEEEPVVDAAFQLRWANDPQGEIRTCIERKEIIINSIDDAKLTKTWKRERDALLKNSSKIITSINQSNPPNDASELGDRLIASQCQRTEKRLLELGDTHPQAAMWFLGDIDVGTDNASQANDLKRGLAQAMSAVHLIMDQDEKDDPKTSKNWQKTEQLIQDLFGVDLNSLTGGDAQETQAAQNLLRAFISESDRQVAELNDSALTTTWDSERAWLLSKLPAITNQVEVTLLLTNASATDDRILALSQKPNPIKMRHVQNLLALDRDVEVEIEPSAEQADSWYFPVNGEYAVSGRLRTHYLLRDSFEFEQRYHADLLEWAEKLKLKDKTIDAIEKLINRHQSTNHLDGYPFFTQTDPRYQDEKLQDAVLLFQLDSAGHDEDADIMWGDAGVGAFFISRQALQARQFDQAWFYWDCY